MISVELEGLAFGEGPRWHDDCLFFSDMHAGQVLVWTHGNKQPELLHQVAGKPSGLGWLPDGRLLVVSMQDKQLLVEEGSRLESYADLSSLAAGHCNDMVVDSQGQAYVGNFGFDFDAGEPLQKTNLILVTTAGEARTVAEDMAFPNGMVITPDGGTLIVGETFGGCLTAFNIEPNADLSSRRLWAQMPEGSVPDGICLDEGGGIWVACPLTGQVLRIEEGGAVTERIQTEKKAYACMLGGTDGRTLYILIAETSTPDQCRQNRAGQLISTRVTHARTGWP